MALIDFRKRKVQLVIFDLGGVLLNLDYTLTQQAFAKLGIDDVKNLYSQAAQTSLFDNLETGHISPETFRRGLEKHTGPQSDSVLDEAWNALLLDLPLERLNLLDRLRVHCPIALLSNTNEIHIEAFESKLAERGVLERYYASFDGLFYSSRIGLRKPETDAFQYVLNRMNAQAENTIFIDDSIQHIKGAQTLGIEAIHLQPGMDITDLFLL